jgi:hypothetical protein
MLIAATTAALVFAGPSLAVPPSLTSVGQLNRHPTATFSAPRAEYVSVYVASRPDRASDGRFLTENVVATDWMTDSEIQAGEWEYANQLDPGTYFVMLSADPDFDACYVEGTGAYDPSCADGFSSVATLAIPTPTSRYAATVKVYRWLGEVDLRLTATPLGVDVPYKVCYALKTKKRRCLSGTLSGYDWNASATGELTVTKRGLGKHTTFTWYIRGRKVATRTVRTV